MSFLYIKIPVANDVPDQFHRLEDKVDQILRKNSVGSVAGWGDSLGNALADGSRSVAYTRIDVDVSNITSAVALLQICLPELGAPAGTEIHYTIDQRRLKDIYFQSKWLLAQPS